MTVCASRVWFRAAIVFIGSVAALLRAARAETPPTLDQIIAGCERTEKLFFESQSMLIRYERTDSVNITPTAFSGKLLPAEWILAFQGNRWYSRRRFTHPEKTEEYVVSGEPKTDVVRDGFVLDWPREFNRASIDRFELGFNIYAGWFYTLNLSLDAPKHIAESNGAGNRLAEIRQKYGDEANLPFLPEFLRANSHQYRVLPTQEEVDGNRCWVVEWPGMDRFNVDPRRGFAIPWRRYHWGPGKPPQFELRNSEYREVKQGLWLPFKQVVIRYASMLAEKQSLWGKPASQTEYRVHAIEVDTLADEFFNVTLPPGTIVYDIPRQFNYTIAADTNADPFAFPVMEGLRVLQRPRFLLLALNIVVILAVLIFISYRAWVKRRRTITG
jgi:hypothetical protein